MNSVTLKITIALFSLSLLSPSATAQQGIDLARAAAAELAKELGDQDYAVFEEPARSYFDWGAIIRPDGRVLSVRAGSVAASIGLKVDDRVLSINDLELKGKALSHVVQYLNGLEHGSALAVTIERDNEPQTLNGQVLATVIPGWRLQIEVPSADQIVATPAQSQGCGRISVFFQPNPIDHYPALINSINGEQNKSLNPNLVLPAGEHVIGVVELINDRQLRRSGSGAREKFLTLVIEPNTTYHIGAHFISSQRYQRVNQNYWEPVIWKVTEQSCSIDK